MMRATTVGFACLLGLTLCVGCGDEKPKTVNKIKLASKDKSGGDSKQNAKQPDDAKDKPKTDAKKIDPKTDTKKPSDDKSKTNSGNAETSKNKTDSTVNKTKTDTGENKNKPETPAKSKTDETIAKNKTDSPDSKTKEQPSDSKSKTDTVENKSKTSEPVKVKALTIDGPPKRRSFRLDYDVTLTELPKGSKVRVWVPLPRSSEHQLVGEVTSERRLPAEAKIGKDTVFGNRMLYFETSAPDSGKVPMHLAWEIDRMEVKGLETEKAEPLPERERKKFLAADRRVPVNDPKPLALLEGTKLPKEPLEIGMALYEKVDEHVKYDKSKPGYGLGDVLWVCDSKFGNCTDFHSLFISLARSKELPAKFEIGFPIPTGKKEGEIGGYHCWAFFFVDGRGWVPVDISEADKDPSMRDYYFGHLTEDRVTFSLGRDLMLEPKQDGEPVNFLIYPYVEVNGKPHEKMDKKFTFKDL
jgi:hypothetical protein